MAGSYAPYARGLQRRNISTGQRSALALRLEPILRAKAKARMLSGKKTDPTPNSAGGIQQGEVRDQIAKLAGVGHTTIQEAKQIIEHGTPEQVERMKRGGGAAQRSRLTARANACRTSQRAAKAFRGQREKRCAEFSTGY